MAFASNNLLSASVDGKAAAASHEASLVQKRTTLQSDCTGDRAGLQAQASKNCAAMAKAAYDAALTGPAAKMQTYFHDDSQATRKTVSEVYRKAYDECRLTPGGKSLTYCTDVDGVCTPGILALTYFVEHRHIYCDFHYQTELLGGCRAQDQSSTVLHETTHLDYVGFTHDHGYGWDAATSLSTELALDSADTYRIYAKDIYGKS